MANPRPPIPTPCDKCKELSTRLRKGLCSPCYERKWREEHRENIRANARRWEKNNPVKRAATVLARVRKDKAANPEKYKKHERNRWRNMTEDEKERRRASGRARYARDPQRRANIKASIKRNPLTKQTIEERRRARKKNVPNTLTTAEWKTIRGAFGGKCAYCSSGGRLTQDHIVPLSKGGHHSLGNIVPACQPCNSRKHTGRPFVPVQPLLL